MDRWKRGLTIFLVALAVLFVIVYYAMASRIENMASISIDIGNFLVVYYCNIINAIVQQKDFDIEEMEGLDFNIDIYNKMDLGSMETLKFLPKHIAYKPILESLLPSFQAIGITTKQICQTPYFRFLSMDIVRGLEAIRPLMHDLIDQALAQTDLDPAIRGINHPVIHFRCADTPFVMNPDYKLRRYTYFRKALDLIQQKTGQRYHRLTILSFVKHRSSLEQQDACMTYASMLQTFLQDELGYQVDIQSKSNIEDFATLFYAPAVISTGGSYSLMSGFFGNGVFIQPQDYPLPQTVDWILPDMNLEHGIVDYYDTAAVQQALQMP